MDVGAHSTRKGKAALQEELRRENCKVKRFDRKSNASDMLTGCLSAEELRKFHDWLPHSDSDERKRPFSRVDAEGMLAAKGTVFVASVAKS